MCMLHGAYHVVEHTNVTATHPTVRLGGGGGNDTDFYKIGINIFLNLCIVDYGSTWETPNDVSVSNSVNSNV